MPGSGQVVEPHGHGVVFYSGDGGLASSVGGYLSEGLRAGDAALVLATAAHRRAFASGLAAAGVDVAAVQAAGRLIMLDADTMLRRFMRGGRLAPSLFEAITGDMLAGLATAGRSVRSYAETVAVLWDAGQAALAIELEELWNALAARLPFSLLCGYPDRLLADAAAAGDVHRVRGLHVSVTGADPGRAELSLPQTREAVRQARRFVSGLLASVGDETLVADAEIVAAELAANAVLHARSEFTVTLVPTQAGVRIAVRDSVPLLPQGATALMATPGHGLGVVAHLADRLAVQPVPGGKVVWAELSAENPDEGQG
jgi:anti-sigma regulatory factor (Ser/Thr protein kinase)